MLKNSLKAGFSFVMFLGGAALFANDVLQWRGNDRTGVYPETGLLKSWPAGGPKKVWEFKEAGSGYGSVTVAGGTVYICGNDVKEKQRPEFVTALNAADGKFLWKTVYGDGWTGSFPEARVTPTVSDGHLFVVSGNGNVACIDAQNGKLKWSRDVKKEYGGTVGMWGTAESPIVADGKVFYTVCGPKTTVVALNVKDGSTVWTSESLGDKAAYVSPILITHKSKRQIVGVTAKYIFSVEPDSGTLLWKTDYLAVKAPGGKSSDINCNTPVYHDGKIFVTSGYDHCAVLLSINDASSEAKILWVNGDLDVHHHGVVILNGHIYGAAWINNNKGTWVCLDFGSGKTLYNQTWEKHSKGTIISADGMLYCYDEQRGTVALVKPSAEKFEVVSEFDLKGGSGRHWCHPVIAGGKFYIRRGEMLSCFDISAQ